MKLSLRAIAAMAITVFYCGFLLACPKTTRALGLDVWNYFHEQEELQAGVDLSIKLNDYDQTITQSIEMKELIARDVAHGRISFSEGTKQFVYLNQANPGFGATQKVLNPGLNEEEINARQLSAYVAAFVNFEHRQSAEAATGTQDSEKVPMCGSDPHLVQ